MLPMEQDYDSLSAGFEWQIPDHYNIGTDVCDRWADSDRLALIHVHSNGQAEHFSFKYLRQAANRLANLLRHLGLESGDRVAILLPQHPLTGISHIATYRLGAVALPLFRLFGPEALAFRLQDAGAKIVITDQAGVNKLTQIQPQPDSLQHILCIDGPAPGALDLTTLMAASSAAFEPVSTCADDPAVLIYTSGTTGQPKGALHAHRVLLGHLPGIEMSHDFLPQAGDRFWTPADWAWIGGLFDVLLAAWHHGLPVVSQEASKFNAEQAFQLLAEQAIRNVFLPPTALKLMRQVKNPRQRWSFRLRSLASGGEPLGNELLAWGRETFGLTINEFYGQTECNMIVSNCSAIMPHKPGAMGRPVVGHQVAIVDDQGQKLPLGEVGNIAVHQPNPVTMLGYWNNATASAAKIINHWLITGDQGRQDQDGYIAFVGRDDDVITSSGYRIGPGEIEDCLLGHPAITLAAVVGLDDPLRTQQVAACVVLQQGLQGSETLAEEIQNYVRQRLAAHEYPRQIKFVDALPMTVTGKIMRQQLKQQWQSL
ncbi:MAG: acyl-CoA synthetase [Gammaproteobacteria bacterium]|nr:acyl-CoA synthetase [Gammaproteobacteria bacterium]